MSTTEPGSSAAAGPADAPATAGAPGPAPRVVVLDHGSGNVRSVVRALEAAGAEVELTADRERALAAAGQAALDDPVAADGEDLREGRGVGADAGDDEPVGREGAPAVRGELDLRPRGLEGADDGADVAGAVVEDDHPGRGAHRGVGVLRGRGGGIGADLAHGRFFPPEAIHSRASARVSAAGSSPSPSSSIEVAPSSSSSTRSSTAPSTIAGEMSSPRSPFL